MTNDMWSDAVQKISKSEKISADDVLTLRREVFADGVVSDMEAEGVFHLNDTCADQCGEWHAYFVEALSDYIVVQAEPRGYVSESNASWVMKRVERDGHIETQSELELLMKILDKAKSSSENLVAFVLNEVKRGVLEGEGPVGAGRELAPGVIGEAEVEMLRRVLYAFGGDGNIAVSRAEAEVLFDLNDATSEADNHASWSDLFVKAVANFLMAASGYVVPAREEALRREDWLEERDTVAGFMGKMMASSLRGILHAYKRDEDMERYARLFGRENMILESEKISALEADWLAHRIGRDGAMHENEKALLEFIRDESPDIHPTLQSLIDRAA